MSMSFMIASGDEHFREMVRENLTNIPNAKVVAEYLEVAANLYIRVLQDLERNPHAALIIDLSGDTEGSLKTLEKVKQAAPDLYVMASNYHADGETVIGALRSGANDFLMQPLKRTEFREAIGRLERAPRRAASGESKLGKVYTFVGTKGGVGTTALATNFASILAQRKQSTVLIDLDWTSNDVAMQLGATPQYTLMEVAENLNRMDQTLFEGFVTRDPLGFFLVGPPDSFEHRTVFTENMFREFATFLVEKYDSIVVDGGRSISDEVVLGASQVSAAVFLVTTQEFPSIRNAQRYIGYMMRMGFSADQIKVVVNRYQKKPSVNYASLEQIQQTLNQPVFYGIPDSPSMLAAVNRARPVVADRQAAPELDKVLRAFADKATGVKLAALKTA
ncbi:MAG: CobQ/CobB/MinD/ParA nucleotide binding domain-containing protein [Bryobacterales bacterium]|nr:CobQ/CobB/MinD/ParA nucleotide binding domain-containing protein [Bryobacterales bacterium]